VTREFRVTAKKIAGALLAGMAMVVLTAGPASAATSPARVLGSCLAHGKGASCTASAQVRHARAVNLFAHVTASPHQRVSGQMEISCSKPGLGAFAGGPISGRTPLKLQFSIPTGFKHCSAIIKAKLRHTGKLHVWITAVTK